MDVKTLCLGVLTFGEASGYDIKKYFECSFSHFFVAGFGSIYPALAELTQEGLVTCKEIAQDGRPARKEYNITAEGRQAFVDALVRTPPRHKIRSEFLVLLYFSHLMPPERLSEVLDERVEEIEANLEVVSHMLSCDRECPKGVRFAAGLGRAVLTTMRDYIETNRDLLFDERDAETEPATGSEDEDQGAAA